LKVGPRVSTRAESKAVSRADCWVALTVDNKKVANWVVWKAWRRAARMVVLKAVRKVACLVHCWAGCLVAVTDMSLVDLKVATKAVH
jgi:hypothetical protein